jgi:hypothetical protein
MSDLGDHFLQSQRCYGLNVGEIIMYTQICVLYSTWSLK